MSMKYKKSNKAAKHDADKPDLSLLPTGAKRGVAKAFMYGASKYGRYNYMKGMEWCRLIGAIDRHISAFNTGQDLDEESGLCHLYHAGASIMMLIEFYEQGVGTDNRFKREENKNE